MFCSSIAKICNAPAAAMPGIEKLPIEETLEDSPQVTDVFSGGTSSLADVSSLSG